MIIYAYFINIFKKLTNSFTKKSVMRITLNTQKQIITIIQNMVYCHENTALQYSTKNLNGP